MPVHAFTSGDGAELFVNGKSQGCVKRAPYRYRFRWDYARYEPGEIKVVAYKQGEALGRTGRAHGPPIRIVASADRSEIAADGRDLSFISVELRDANGVFVPTDKRQVRFTLKGPGAIVATDNGDPTDFNSFSSASRALFNVQRAGGRARAIVRGIASRTGAVEVTVAAEGMPATTVRILKW